MDYQSFQERLNEVKRDFHEPGAKRKKLLPSQTLNTEKSEILAGYRTPTVHTVNKFADALGMIPIVCLYRENGEDLGVEGFFTGESVRNYEGRVIKKHRLKLGLDEKELADKVNMTFVSYVAYEYGEPKDKPLYGLEAILNTLDITPLYLFPAQRIHIDRAPDFRTTLRLLQTYMIQITANMLYQEDITQAVEYSNEMHRIAGLLKEMAEHATLPSRRDCRSPREAYMEEKELLRQAITKGVRELGRGGNNLVAEIVGMDPSHLSNVTGGFRWLKEEKLEKILEALEISREDILNGNKE